MKCFLWFLKIFHFCKQRIFDLNDYKTVFPNLNVVFITAVVSVIGSLGMDNVWSNFFYFRSVHKTQ